MIMNTAGIIIKKTVVTFEALVQSNNTQQLSKLGVEISMEGMVSDSFPIILHADIQKISHIEPYWNDESKCFVTLEGEHYLLNHSHSFVVQAMNWSLIKHNALSCPFALFHWKDIQNVLTTESFRSVP